MAPKGGGILRRRIAQNKIRRESRRKEQSFRKSKNYPKKKEKATRKECQAQLKGSISTDVKYAEKYTF